ncbi:hypothetical protein SUGI_0062980 [Cryptomeria japonica]|nr:hypothetical protein SUGI_0062980 [Cryptomeria japonica]
MWAKNSRHFPHANQDTNVAIKSYHCKLKMQYVCDRQRKYTKRMDPCIIPLPINWRHSIDISGVCNKMALLATIGCPILQTSIERAREIPNADVVANESQPGWFWVKSQSSCNWYVVRVFGRDLYICDCPWSLQGNTFKHILKVVAMQEDVRDGVEVGSCICIL